MLPPRPPWFDQAACRDLGPALFFPEGRDAERDARSAISVCRTCPARLDCAQHALNEGEEWGIWGGLDEKTRSRVRRGRTRANYIREAP